MRAKLTKTNIEKLTPAPKPYEVYDTELRGLILRVQPQGQRTWYLRYRLPAGRRRTCLGTYPGLSADGARTMAQRLLGEVAAGVDVQQRKEQERARTVREKASALGAFVANEYGPWCRANLKAGAFHVERLKADFGQWWHLPMARITVGRVDDWRKSERERGVSPRTVNRRLSRLRSALVKAVDWGLLDANPIAAIKPLRHDKTLRVRYLTPDQEACLFAALEKREQDMRERRASFNAWRLARGMTALEQYPEPFADYVRPLVLVVRNTGLRRAEALSLRWSDVDLTHRIVTIAGVRAKTQQTRRVPLNAVAVATLRTWKEQRKPGADSEFTFGHDPEDRQLRIDTAWRGIRKAAGLNDLRFHDLRHHFASKLVQKGTDLNTVRELLGHASIDMTLAYAHLAPDGLAAAVERIV